MDILTDEHEREEAVRKWWHEHWKSIALGVTIALAGLVGVRQYQAYQLSENQKTAYEVYQLQKQISTQGVNAMSDAQAFLDQHKDAFGAILALDMANAQIRAKNYVEAEKFASFAAANGGDLIAPQASIIKARLLTQDGKTDEALKTLDSIKSTAYKAEVAETRGDIYMSLNDRANARTAYLDAINTNKADKIQISPMLQLKFDNVIVEGDTPAYKIVAEQAKEMSAVSAQ